MRDLNDNEMNIPPFVGRKHIWRLMVASADAFLLVGIIQADNPLFSPEFQKIIRTLDEQNKWRFDHSPKLPRRSDGKIIPPRQIERVLDVADDVKELLRYVVDEAYKRKLIQQADISMFWSKIG